MPSHFPSPQSLRFSPFSRSFWFCWSFPKNSSELTHVLVTSVFSCPPPNSGFLLFLLGCHVIPHQEERQAYPSPPVPHLSPALALSGDTRVPQNTSFGGGDLSSLHWRPIFYSVEKENIFIFTIPLYPATPSQNTHQSAETRAKGTAWSGYIHALADWKQGRETERGEKLRVTEPGRMRQGEAQEKQTDT